MALCLVLSFVLGRFFSLLKMPFGGSLSPSALPILFFSLKRGIRNGILCGFLLSLVKIFTGFFLPPISGIFAVVFVVILDYILPNMSLGLASIFAKNKKTAIRITFGIFVAFLFKFIFRFTSGILFWHTFFEEGSLFYFSFIYNFNIISEFLFCLFLVLFLRTKVDKYFTER